MTFNSTRIITGNINAVIDFYQQITGCYAHRLTEDFAEFRTPLATLAIGSTRTLNFFGGESVATPSTNRSVILEFRVDDVDAHYERLSHFLKDVIVQIPTTMPWGNRSFLFRDPDGNLINFFTPTTPEAAQRLK
ncbi:VOC family protein [Dyadobacter crusticola]|uniref:VOC family protein n=1 Tax=Dyadobacter crusticola TaxID=292407 RepID=UPI0004E1B6EB|nr:VOC family protein [Dyadobacter crusticola]